MSADWQTLPLWCDHTLLNALVIASQEVMSVLIGKSIQVTMTHIILGGAHLAFLSGAFRWLYALGHHFLRETVELYLATSPGR